MYNGIELWGGRSQGAFWVTESMKVGLSYNSSSASAIEYLVQKSGTVTVGVDSFLPNLNNVYLAIAVNGEMVWPNEGAALSAKTNWFLANKTSDNTATLQQAWQDLSIAVEEGDSLTFLLTAADGAGQTILHPVVYYR